MTELLPNNCFRKAVSLAYEIPYDDLPDRDPDDGLEGFWAGWEMWAATQNKRWWTSEKIGPTFLTRWIAHLGPNHYVAMAGDQLLADPLAGPIVTTDPREVPNPVKRVGPNDVREARALIPAEAPDPAGDSCWAINTEGDASGN